MPLTDSHRFKIQENSSFSILRPCFDGEMENMLVDELTQGPEQESELSTSIELCMSLAQEILASIDKALSIAQSSGCPSLAVGRRDNPPSPRSPHSEITEGPLTAEGKEMISKKRKRLPKWSIITQLKSASRAEGEGPFDDGFSWRKHGQLIIPAAKYPRFYYKCIHHNCPAKRRVQPSDDNPAIFKVTYDGTHTCDQKPSLPAAAASSFFSSSLPSTLDNSCMHRSTDEFISPATSELNCFSSSPGRVTSHVEPQTLQALESDFTETVSALTSTGNSSVFDLDYLFQSSESDPCISILNSHKKFILSGSSYSNE